MNPYWRARAALFESPTGDAGDAGAAGVNRGVPMPAARLTNQTIGRTRDVNALAFIAVQNAQRKFPRPPDIRAYLNLGKTQTDRIVNRLRRSKQIVRTNRGYEVCVQ